ncbi:hypothetical protein UCRPC4_g06662 [Phaeomoniella chlamydospora]|uniref:Uncharacterized protein n=1 Tax=Phaeomoniella chlamydospora TaxID=158046 RepID=A0A0G2DVE3_PHACM|nr:hypothetical protein UCRPC4_g06662 [Phaeomoniella chlamydospora]
MDNGPKAGLVASPGQTTSSTHAHKYSSDSSYLSPTSTSTSVHQDDFLFDVKALSYLNENNEPQWEMVSSDKVHEMNAKMKKYRRNDRKPSPLAEESPEAKDEKRDTLTMNDEALAALEAPPPRGQDVAPLRASKEAVDRIMSPPPKANFPAVASEPNQEARKNAPIPSLRVRTRADTNARLPELPGPEPKASIENLMTRVTNDLDDLEQQIESRAVRAMKKQLKSAQGTASNDRSTSPSTSPIQLRGPPVRSATEDNVRSASNPKSDSMKETETLSRAKSLDNIKAAAKPRQSPQTFPSPPAVKHVSPLDMVRELSPTPKSQEGVIQEEVETPSFSVTCPSSEPEVYIARSISVSKRQPRMLLPPASKNQGSENLVEKRAQGPLTPQIVDIAAATAAGKARGHRYERSQNALVENA